MNDILNKGFVDKLNNTLNLYPDKDWNYSRIVLVYNELEKLSSPYCLWCDLADRSSDEGKRFIKRTEEEIAWGKRHMNELGILEIVSFRINKALADIGTQDIWGRFHPILRVENKERIAERGINACLWYRVEEVVGEDFESR